MIRICRTWFVWGVLAACIHVFDTVQESPERTAAKTWIDLLPGDVRDSILWSADHEQGTLVDWEYDRNENTNGGGVFNSGANGEAIAKIVQQQPLTGNYCAEATILNAFEARTGAKAVRLMRWTDRPWDQGGKDFPRSAYFGVWMRLNKNYNLGDSTSSNGGWWNVFQFKSEDEQGTSQPMWVLNIGNHPNTGNMQFYLYSKWNRPQSRSQRNPVPIPVGRWFHVEALYEQSTEDNANGKIKVWQDGQLILSAENVRTKLQGKVIWGIGNYTDHVSGGDKPGSATIFFDDATIAIQPTHGHVDKILKR